MHGVIRQYLIWKLWIVAAAKRAWPTYGLHESFLTALRLQKQEVKPPGYKLVMDKFGLTIRKFLIIRGIEFCELPDRRGSGLGTPWNSAGGERGKLEGLEHSSFPFSQGLLCIISLWYKEIALEPNSLKALSKMVRKVTLSGATLLQAVGQPPRIIRTLNFLPDECPRAIGSACDPRHSHPVTQHWYFLLPTTSNLL